MLIQDDSTPTVLNAIENIVSTVNLDEHKDAIVAALGGINVILTDYIRISKQHGNEDLLNINRLHQISNIISPSVAANDMTILELASKLNSNSTIWDRLYERAKLRDDTFHLKKADTVLHCIIPNRDTADRLINFLFSKITMIAITFLLFIVSAISMRQDAIERNGFMITLFVTAIIWAIYMILIILSSNVCVLSLVLLTFDFWMKVGYAILFAVSWGIFVRRGDLHPNVVTYSGVGSLLLVFIVMTISLIEGYHVSWKISFGFGLVLSVVGSIQAVLFTLYPDAFGYEESKLEIWPGVSFGLLSFMASTLRILSLFMWKQTLMTAYTRGEWCICIYLTPQIKWEAED